jgi:hypothetical protein
MIEALIRSADRTPRQRTTLYAQPARDVRQNTASPTALLPIASA